MGARAVGALGLIVGVGVGVGVGASTANAATPAPVPVTLGAITVTAESVTGSLTLRADGDPVALDPGSLHGRLGSKEISVSTDGTRPFARTAMLVVDTSGSMGASGMATIRASVAEFLAAVPPDVRVGLASFASTAGVEVVPTLDRARVQSAVDELRSDGNTSLFAAITTATGAMGGAGDRSIVLLSDGGDTVAPDRTLALAQAVRAISASGVRAEVIAFKTGETDDAALAAFAAAGGGSVAPASDASAVRQAFRTAARVLDTQVFWSANRNDDSADGKQTITLSGSASGRPFTVTTTVNLTATATTGSPSAVVPTAPVADASTAAASPARAPTTTWMLPVALLLTFLATFVAIVTVVAPMLRSRRHERLVEIEQYSLTPRSRSERRQDAPSDVSVALVSWADRRMTKRESTSRTMALIERADLPWRAGEWLLLRLFAVAIGATVGSVLMGGRAPLLGLVGGGVLGLVLPAFFLRFKAARRAKAFEELLPDVLMLVATSLSSGFSLPQALDAIATDAAEPASKEFSRALAETRIGADLTDSLERMAVRMDSESLRWTTMAISIQRDVGGNLAETLRTTARTLRERGSVKRQVDTLSAEGKLSAYILIALPIFIFIYMTFTNYGYVSLLWSNLIGWSMIAASLVGMVIGIIWMRSVIRIEV